MKCTNLLNIHSSIIGDNIINNLFIECTTERLLYLIIVNCIIIYLAIDLNLILQTYSIHLMDI